MSLKNLLHDLANYEFNFKRAHINVHAPNTPPCAAFTKIKRLITKKPDNITAGVYALIHEIRIAAKITEIAYECCSDCFELLHEKLYGYRVDGLTMGLAGFCPNNEKLNSLKEEILDYDFDFRNFDRANSPVCKLHGALREIIEEALNPADLSRLFRYLCYIKVIAAAKQIVLDELTRDNIESFIAELRDDYNEIAEKIRVLAEKIANEVSEK